MTDAHAILIERLRQNRSARETEGTAARATGARSPVVHGATFVQGDRVFDTVSGLEGEVVAGSRQNIVVPSPQR